MRCMIQAACGCHTGKVRKNNEDNFYFDGKCLEMEHNGLISPAILEGRIRNGLCMAVFDGMGGERFGEKASFAAAHQMQVTQRTLVDYFIPERRYLERMVLQMNDAVVRVQQEMLTDRIGTTMVGFYFSGRYIYVCNIGDSRAYRLRDDEFLQLSQDHVEKRPGKDLRKAPLTQYLGFGNEEIQIEPYIAKGEIKRGDMYLLCSDGLTDMLTNYEITDIMLRAGDAESCVRDLLQSALEHGGRDNITVVICRIT